MSRFKFGMHRNKFGCVEVLPHHFVTKSGRVAHGVELNTVYIKKSQRHHGHGAELVSHVVNKLGVNYIIVYPINKSKNSFFKQLGFKNIKHSSRMIKILNPRLDVMKLNIDKHGNIHQK